jgi:hypothetical protein
MQFSTSACHGLSPRFKYSTQHHVSKQPPCIPVGQEMKFHSYTKQQIEVYCCRSTCLVFTLRSNYGQEVRRHRILN